MAMTESKIVSHNLADEIVSYAGMEVGDFLTLDKTEHRT